MTLTKKDFGVKIDDMMYYVGTYVVATRGAYKGLKGIIREIRTGDDAEAESKGVVVYCDFVERGKVQVQDENGRSKDIPYEIIIENVLVNIAALVPAEVLRYGKMLKNIS